MIFRLKFKYKYVCAVIIFIVISLFGAFFKAASQRMCGFGNEPIDVVYTWVNGSDPHFVKSLKRYSKDFQSKTIDKSSTRYFDRHELKFSLRSLEKYAPWIRNVYIVTNGQIPYWLNIDYEKVILISHEEIFPDSDDLPTFSSPAIETHIHRIPGLSKKFLYFNDDIYLGAPVSLTDFYVSGHGYLIYLDYPMQSCTKDCPWIFVHDGHCDNLCNVPDCQMDGGDCDLITTNPVEINPRQTWLNVSYLYTMKTTESSQNITLTTKKERQLKEAIERLPPNLEKSSVKRLIDKHNRNKILEDKLRRKKEKRGTNPRLSKKYFDAYRESLQHTNRVFNFKYGFAPRYVPAHMPFLIDKDVMVALQETFPNEFEKTSLNRIRSKDDMQFSFSYFHFLLSETTNVDIETIFDEFDTDLSSTWSDREIRTILTRISELPLSTTTIDDFEGILMNCSKVFKAEAVLTPEYERYIDSILPTISKELITGCPEIKKVLLEKFSKRPKYLYEIIKNVSKYVSFEMIESDILSTVLKLDKIRRKPTKFVCINDNMYRKHNESSINAIWYDFYLSLFPLPSKFELPSEYRNRFFYIKDLRQYQTTMNLYLYGCLLISIYFLLYFLCKNKFIYFWNKLFCC